MDIKHYFNVLTRKAWILILLPVLSAGIAIFISYYTYTPMYLSNVTLLVINKQTDSNYSESYSNILAGQQLVKEYKEIIKSRTVTKLTLDELGLDDLRPEELAQNISVTLKNETRILVLTVEDENAERAMQLANKVSDVFKKKAVELVKAENVEVIDPAEKSETPTEVSYKKTFLIAILSGMLLAIGIIFIIEELDDTIKTSEDVEKHLNLKTLGTIPVLDFK